MCILISVDMNLPNKSATTGENPTKNNNKNKQIFENIRFEIQMNANFADKGILNGKCSDYLNKM